MDEPSKTVGKRVAEARSLGGIDRATLSRLAKLKSPSHVGQIERGTVEHPSATTLDAIARVLGCSLDWLIRGAGSPPTARRVKISIDIARGVVSTDVA